MQKSDNCRGISAQAGCVRRRMRACGASGHASGLLALIPGRCRFRLNHTLFPDSRDDGARCGGRRKKIKETTWCDIAVTMSVVMLHAQEAGDISETRPRDNSLASRYARACPRRSAVCKIAIVRV